MRLSEDRLRHYIKAMSEKTIEVMKNDFKIHGFMIYQCQECNSIYVMWLAEGLEDPTDDAKTGKHKPVPYGITCPSCGGIAFHSFFNVGKMTLGMNHRSYKDYISQQNKLLYENFFWNDPESESGVPIIFSNDYPMVDPRMTLKILNRIIANIAIEFMDKNDFKDCCFIDENPSPKETSVEIVFDELKNRHERLHPNQHDGYKRPRSNKKLYEY